MSILSTYIQGTHFLKLKGYWSIRNRNRDIHTIPASQPEEKQVSIFHNLYFSQLYPSQQVCGIVFSLSCWNHYRWVTYTEISSRYQEKCLTSPFKWDAVKTTCSQKFVEVSRRATARRPPPVLGGVEGYGIAVTKKYKPGLRVRPFCSMYNLMYTAQKYINIKSNSKKNQCNSKSLQLLSPHSRWDKVGAKTVNEQISDEEENIRSYRPRNYLFHN